MRDILPSVDSSEPFDVLEFGNSLYFAADDGTHGFETWKVSLDSTVRVMVRTKVVRLGPKRTAKISITCPANELSGPCTGDLNLRSRKTKRLPGKAKFSVPAGRIRTVKVKVTRATRRALLRNQAARSSRLTVNVRDGSGNRRIVASVQDANGNRDKFSADLKLLP